MWETCGYNSVRPAPQVIWPSDFPVTPQLYNFTSRDRKKKKKCLDCRTRLLIQLNAPWLLSADQTKSKEGNVWSWKACQRLDDRLLNKSGIKKKGKKCDKPFSARCRVFQGGWCRNRWGRRRSLDRRGALHCRSTEILKQGKKQEVQIQLTALFQL